MHLIPARDALERRSFSNHVLNTCLVKAGVSSGLFLHVIDPRTPLFVGRSGELVAVIPYGDFVKS